MHMYHMFSFLLGKYPWWAELQPLKDRHIESPEPVKKLASWQRGIQVADGINVANEPTLK